MKIEDMATDLRDLRHETAQNTTELKAEFQKAFHECESRFSKMMYSFLFRFTVLAFGVASTSAAAYLFPSLKMPLNEMLEGRRMARVKMEQDEVKKS